MTPTFFVDFGNGISHTIAVDKDGVMTIKIIGLTKGSVSKIQQDLATKFVFALRSFLMNNPNRLKKIVFFYDRDMLEIGSFT